MTNGQVEVITSVERRRRWSFAEKRQLVDVTACLHAGRNRLAQPGTNLAAIGGGLSATYRLITVN